MSQKFVVQAESRDDMGKGASRRLRREGKVPGIIYGSGKEPVSIAVPHNEIVKQLDHEAFYSSILTLEVGGKKEPAILKDLQRHPSKPFINHVDFQRVSDKEPIRVVVPLHFTGEDVAPGVKIGGGIVTHNITELEVQCLPKDLPEYLEVDLSTAELGHSVHLTDIKLPKGVEIVELMHGSEHDQPVAAVQSTRGSIEAAAGGAEEEEAAGEAEEGGEA